MHGVSTPLCCSTRVPALWDPALCVESTWLLLRNRHWLGCPTLPALPYWSFSHRWLCLSNNSAFQTPIGLRVGRLASLVFTQVAQLPLFISDGKWHHICVTWTTRDGMWEAFQDGEKLGTGDNLAPWHPIKPGGVLILGQEQVSALTSLPSLFLLVQAISE